MASKTRDKLIDVARSLFLRKGVENTTISDIADASDKGRRTIYTYFKTKKELYNAVIERESDDRVRALREIVESHDSPSSKLRRFFEMRFSQNPVSAPSDSMWRSLLRLDFFRTDTIRKKAYVKEEALLFAILDEGIASGEFDSARCGLMRDFLYRLFNAIDTLSMHDEYTPVEPSNSDAFMDFLIKGVQK